MTSGWTLTLPCTRAEAEAIDADHPSLATLDPLPTLVTQEVEAFNDARWELIAYFNNEPDGASVAAIQTLVPSAAAAPPVIAPLPDEDWVTVSQQGIAPVHAGRFYVHTATNKGAVPNGAKVFQIDAGQAFGTGTHETTEGCLKMLDTLKNCGARFDHVADIGTGTGLLAFAARHLWPRSYGTATDIDPISVAVTAENAIVNGVALGQRQGAIALCAAAGTDHELIARRAPYDLVIANILAGPLIALAPALVESLRVGGTLILAGLLNTQAGTVITAYRAQGMRLARRRDTGDWPCLCLVKRQRSGWRRPVRLPRRPSQGPGDFGTW
jgi:ribosomal protein L11 methyltransferase